VLRDQGIGYGDYVEQITYLLFLKMDQERTELLGEPSSIPEAWRWERLAPLAGDELELRYRPTLETCRARAASPAPSSVARRTSSPTRPS
jgi:type I restriction enzyme M protein